MPKHDYIELSTVSDDGLGATDTDDVADVVSSAARVVEVSISLVQCRRSR